MDHAFAHNPPPSRKKAILYCIYAIVLLLLNVILLISGHRDELSHIAYSFEDSLRAVDPYYVLGYAVKSWAPWNWCFSSSSQCVEQARQRLHDFDQFWSSFSVLSIVLYAVAFAAAGIAWMAWSDGYTAKSGDRIPTAVGFWAVLIGASAITWILRLLLLSLTLVFGWVLGFVFWLDAVVLSVAGWFMHGRDLLHGFRQVGGAIQQVRDVPKPPPE